MSRDVIPDEERWRSAFPMWANTNRTALEPALRPSRITWLQFSICAGMTNNRCVTNCGESCTWSAQTREGWTKQRHRTSFHGSDTGVQHWSRQKVEQTRFWSKLSTNLTRGWITSTETTKREKTSTYEATLTNVLNTQVKDWGHAKLINVLMPPTRITKMWQCYIKFRPHLNTHSKIY